MEAAVGTDQCKRSEGEAQGCQDCVGVSVAFGVSLLGECFFGQGCYLPHPVHLIHAKPLQRHILPSPHGLPLGNSSPLLERSHFIRRAVRRDHLNFQTGQLDRDDTHLNGGDCECGGKEVYASGEEKVARGWDEGEGDAGLGGVCAERVGGGDGEGGDWGEDEAERRGGSGMGPEPCFEGTGSCFSGRS